MRKIALVALLLCADRAHGQIGIGTQPPLAQAVDPFGNTLTIQLVTDQCGQLFEFVMATPGPGWSLLANNVVGGAWVMNQKVCGASLVLNAAGAGCIVYGPIGKDLTCQVRLAGIFVNNNTMQIAPVATAVVYTTGE